jgi:tetratricopeptide (TPR) repeat protein
VLSAAYQGRAVCLGKLQKYPESLADWDRCLELIPPNELPKYQLMRALAVCRSGKVSDALAEGERLKKLAGRDGTDEFNFALLYLVAAGKTAEKRREYEDAAMGHLEEAVKLGYKNVTRWASDKDLDPLRERDEFKKLLADLRAQYPPVREVLPPPRAEK